MTTYSEMTDQELAAAMTDQELAAAIAATEAAIRCPRTTGVFLNSYVSACRRHLALLLAEQASRTVTPT